MTKRTETEAKDALLDAGVEIFLTEASNVSPEHVLGHLDLGDVARAAGYSGPGMVYNLWGDSGDRGSGARNYRADLLDRLTSMPASRGAHQRDPTNHAGTSSTSGNRLRDLTDAAVTRQRAATRTGMMQAVRVARRGTTTQATMRDVHIHDLDNLAGLLRGNAKQDAADGDVVSHEQVAVLVRSLIEGYADFVELAPGYTEHTNLNWRGTSGWTLAAIATDVLVTGLTQATPADRADAPATTPPS